MNPQDAPNYLILTALNLHPLHRRKGVLIQRSEVIEALRDLGLDIVHRLPKGRLVGADEVERLMATAGFSTSFIERAFAASHPWVRTAPALKRFLDLRAELKDRAIAKAAGEALSAEGAAHMLGVTDKAIYKSQKEGRILGFQEPGKRSYFFPVFQFDGAAVAPWVPELIQILGPGFAALHFLTVKRKHLDGASLLDLFSDAKPDERHVVARKILTEARSHLP